MVGKYSIERFSVTVRGGGHFQCCHRYLLFVLDVAQLHPPQGTNMQATLCTVDEFKYLHCLYVAETITKCVTA